MTVTASAGLTVQVTNVDEPGNADINSDSPRTGEPVTATLSDPDGGVGNLRWQWQRQEGDRWDDIAGANGASYTPGTGDIGHRLQAVATYDDNAGAGHSAQAATANPVRNDPPAFNDATAILVVDENSPAGTPVGTPLTAQDPNGDPISYSLTGNGAFAVNPETGQITVATGAELDFETQAIFALTLRAEDSHGDHDDIEVTVNLNNVDEPGTATLSHDDLRTGTVITASLSDPDGSVSGENWRWSRSGESIAGATGNTYTASSADVGHILTAAVSYTDGEGPGKSASRSTTTQVGNDAPAFPMGNTARTMDENAPAGTAAGAPVTASDPNGDTLTYSLAESDAFEADQDGTVRNTRELDFETADSHTLILTATDEHGASGQTTVTVTVNNLDEPGTVTLTHNTPRTGDVITAELSDPDGDTSSETWQWSRAGNDISGASSATHTVGADDLGHRLSVRVSYTDPQGTGKSAQAETSEAVSNDPPSFALQSTSFTVAEDAPVGTAAGEPLRASDPNSDAISFSLSGDGAADFAVDADGQLTVAATLDHENRDSYNLTATVSDPAGGSDSMDITITVTNVEETGSAAFDSAAQPEVNTPLTAGVTDPDGNLSGESWTWSRGTSTEGPWTVIERATGASYTPQAQDVNFHLRATVSYTDGHGSERDTAHATTGLPVRPEPNRPPAFLDSLTTTFNISVNVREGVRVAPPFTAEDPNGDTLVYSIVPGTPDAFTINPATGEVLMGSLELTESATFTASISVTDGVNTQWQEDLTADDSLDLTMTIVNPNIVIEPSSHAAFPKGLWVDDDIVVTTNDSGRDRAMFYDRATQQHLEDRSFRVGGNSYPTIRGTWSDGTTLYALAAQRSRANPGGKIFAHRLSDGARRSSKDIILPSENAHPIGLTGREGVLYVGDGRDRKIYAYDIETRSRRSDHDVNGIDTFKRNMTDFWLDGETIWISYWLSDFIRAYDVATGDSKPGLDVQLARENAGPSGIDSDGFNLWCMDSVNDTIYGYVLPQ